MKSYKTVSNERVKIDLRVVKTMLPYLYDGVTVTDVKWKKCVSPKLNGGKYIFTMIGSNGSTDGTLTMFDNIVSEQPSSEPYIMFHIVVGTNKKTLPTKLSDLKQFGVEKMLKCSTNHFNFLCK